MAASVVTAALLPLCLLQVAVCGRTLFVSPQGDDVSCDGLANVAYASGRSACAFRTVSVGVARLAGGDTLRIQAGTYPGTTQSTVNAAGALPVWITADGEAVLVAANNGTTAFAVSRSNVLISGLSLRGFATCFIWVGWSNITIASNTCTDAYGDLVYIRGSSNVTVENNVLIGRRLYQRGVMLFGFPYSDPNAANRWARVIGNIIIDVCHTGIIMHAQAKHVLVEGNVLVNVSQAIQLYNFGHEDVVLRGNVVDHCGSALTLSGANGVVVQGNTFSYTGNGVLMSVNNASSYSGGACNVTIIRNIFISDNVFSPIYPGASATVVSMSDSVAHLVPPGTEDSIPYRNVVLARNDFRLPSSGSYWAMQGAANCALLDLIFKDNKNTLAGVVSLRSSSKGTNVTMLDSSGSLLVDLTSTYIAVYLPSGTSTSLDGAAGFSVRASQAWIAARPSTGSLAIASSPGGISPSTSVWDFVVNSTVPNNPTTFVLTAPFGESQTFDAFVDGVAAGSVTAGVGGQANWTHSDWQYANTRILFNSTTPQIKIAHPLDGAKFVSGTPILLTWFFIGNMSGPAVATVNGRPYSSAQNSVSITGLDPGQYSFDVSGNDTKGTTFTTVQRSFTVVAASTSTNIELALTFEGLQTTQIVASLPRIESDVATALSVPVSQVTASLVGNKMVLVVVINTTVEVTRLANVLVVQIEKKTLDPSVSSILSQATSAILRTPPATLPSKAGLTFPLLSVLLAGALCHAT